MDGWMGADVKIKSIRNSQQLIDCVCVCVCVCVLVAQSCPTPGNPIDCSPPGPSVHGTLQARTLEWVAISFSKRNYRKKESDRPYY